MIALPCWSVEGRVIHLKLTGSLLENQLSALDKAMVSFLRAGTAPMIHLMLDVSDLESLPPITALSRMNFLRHHRHGWWVIVGSRPGSAIHNALHLLGDTYQILLADKEDDSAAHHFIRAVDPTMRTPALIS